MYSLVFKLKYSQIIQFSLRLFFFVPLGTCKPFFFFEQYASLTVCVHNFTTAAVWYLLYLHTSDFPIPSEQLNLLLYFSPHLFSALSFSTHLITLLIDYSLCSQRVYCPCDYIFFEIQTHVMGKLRLFDFSSGLFGFSTLQFACNAVSRFVFWLESRLT